MKRIISIMLIISAFGMNVHAKGKSEDTFSRMTFGLEWGYVASIYAGHHYSYFVPEGYRVNEYGSSFGCISNADMYIHLGYDLTPMWNLSMYIGYEGISNLHKAVPVSLRMTRFFNGDSSSDRWFSFIDLGSGICLKTPIQEILTGKLGGGYRLSLGRYAALDFLLSARLTYTHPQIIYDNTPIPFNRTNINRAYIGSLSLGMAINF